MAGIGEHVKSDDWKTEKHVPVIECPDEAVAGEPFEVTVSVGKEIAHPNTTEHHIRWIDLYFHPDGAAFTYHVGRFEFCAHGEAAGGANDGPVSTEHAATASMKTTVAGTLHAMSYCNIHGLWESSKPVAVR